MRHAPALWLSLLVLLPVSALAADPAHEQLPLLTEVEEEALHATLGRIGAIRAPLLARPAFVGPDLRFDAEIELPTGGRIESMWLERGLATCTLAPTVVGSGRSEAWPDVALQVTRVRLAIGSPCAPALYDIHLSYSSGSNGFSERQVHAVKIMDPARYAALASGAAQPRIVVLADPQIGDPRGALESAQEDPDGVPAELNGLVGDGSTQASGTWTAVRTALAEARALDPDFVLIAGDLGFGQLVPGSYAAEFEEIWRVLVEADVPMFVAPGNHDGYVSNGQDGYAYWRAYIGPLYTLAPSVPRTHVLVLNTYDWSEMDRIGVSYGVSAWGGQVRDAQMAWVTGALGSLRNASGSSRVIAVMHHSPSWRQDPWEPMAEGIPVAEQVERGARTYASTDQGWIGKGRLELRDLLRAHRVEVAFAGHTHHDRVARDDGAGGIIGTYQTDKAMPADFDFQALHYWTRDDIITMGASQEQLADLMRLPTGPLYVDTTTTMSDGKQYWGYRPVEFSYDASGRLELPKLGYPLTQAELDALALHPELFNVSHASLGLFSKPLELDMHAPWSLVPE